MDNLIEFEPSNAPKALRMLSSKRSVKMRRSPTATQRKRRAWSISTARRPAIGKSAKRRGHRLWTRSETAPHDGHALFALRTRIVRTALPPSARGSPGRQNPVGILGHHLAAANPVGSRTRARTGLPAATRALNAELPTCPVAVVISINGSTRAVLLVPRHSDLDRLNWGSK